MYNSSNFLPPFLALSALPLYTYTYTCEVLLPTSCRL